MKKKELIFVYNAGSDIFSMVTDFAHKILSPSTYDCHLCSLTHDNFSMKQEWKSFIAALPVKTVFLHKDEFIKQYKLVTDFPAVFMVVNGAVKEIIARYEIEKCQSLDELKKLVTQKINDYVQHHHPSL